MRSAGMPSVRQMSYASASRGMPFSPLKIETTILFGSSFQTPVSSSHAKGSASALK